jgi:di/tricarboxylate transporter
MVPDGPIALPVSVAIVIGLLIAAVVLFATEKVAVDVTALLLIVTLVVTGILTPEEAFSGFSSDIIVILGSLFVISGALQETGLLDLVAARLLKFAGRKRRTLLLTLMGSSAGVSAFMNNTTVTAMLLGPVMSLARSTNTAASKLLIPLAYASILGGTCTLIGTSTNVAVSGYMVKAGMEPLGLFEITPVGVVILAVGILYMMTIGTRLLPENPEGGFAKAYAMRDYLSEIVVLPSSPLIGQTPREWELALIGFQLLKIFRGDAALHPDPNTRIAEGDTLLVEGRIENLMKVRTIEGIEIKSTLDLDAPELKADHSKVAEILLNPQSEIVGRGLREARFRERFGLSVLAIYRQGKSVRDELAEIRLQVGDILLVEGPEDRVDSLRSDSRVTVLDEHRPPGIHTRKGMWALGIFAAAVIASGLGWIPLSIAFLCAALLIILSRCISVEQARSAIDLRMLVFIGAMTAFGTAMEKSGAAELIAQGVVNFLGSLGAMAVLAGFFLVTILLTQPMSNAAAALVVLPVAMNAASKLGASERSFAIGVMLAASVSFIAPLEPSCVLVYGPGKYRFMDFVRTGAGLTFVLILVVLALLPIFWPLYPVKP